MIQMSAASRPKTARANTTVSEGGNRILHKPRTNNTLGTSVSARNVIGDEAKQQQTAKEIVYYLNAFNDQQKPFDEQTYGIEAVYIDKKGEQNDVVPTVQTPRFSESKASKATGKLKTAQNSSKDFAKSNDTNDKEFEQPSKKEKSSSKMESQLSLLEEVKLALGKNLDSGETPKKTRRKPKAQPKTSRAYTPDSKVQTVVSTRPLTQDTLVQLPEITKQFKENSTKKETLVKSARANTVEKKRGSVRKLKKATSSVITPSSSRSNTQQPILPIRQSTHSARSVKATKSDTDTKIKPTKKLQSGSVTTDRLQRQTPSKTPTNMKVNNIAKEAAKLNEKIMLKLLEKETHNHKGKPNNVKRAISEKFLDIQNKNVDEQLSHLLALQDKLELEVKAIMNLLEEEQGSDSETNGNSSCFCTPDTRSIINSLLEKQKLIIKLQTDLRKRYANGLNSAGERNKFDSTILDGFNVNMQNLLPCIKEINGKLMSFFCNSCNVSCPTELTFRTHLESPQHVVKAYKEIQRQLPTITCDECNVGHKGTTKYMNHIVGESHGTKDKESNIVGKVNKSPKTSRRQ